MSRILTVPMQNIERNVLLYLLVISVKLIMLDLGFLEVCDSVTFRR
jgi:hypothetical protein